MPGSLLGAENIMVAKRAQAQPRAQGHAPGGDSGCGPEPMSFSCLAAFSTSRVFTDVASCSPRGAGTLGTRSSQVWKLRHREAENCEQGPTAGQRLESREGGQ